ncbi:MAG: hypothetical protein LBC58_04610 [Clostridiales Family XIII bacterium]|jgi:hypothetical protein|nr:hypothetical protein [Clostridiales Family XIII bacterium]
MKLLRKNIETAEAIDAMIQTAERNAEKLWPKTRKLFERAKTGMANEDEAKRAWLTAVIAADTYLMGESRNMSRAELTNVHAALDARFAGGADADRYEYFRGLVLYSLSDPDAAASGKLYPLVSGLLNVLHSGFDAAIKIDEEGDPDALSAAYPALLRDIGVIFSLQLIAWRHVFENYKVTFTAV